MEKGRGHRIKDGFETHRGGAKIVEGRNFETRKHLLEYDDVMNKQRRGPSMVCAAS